MITLRDQLPKLSIDLSDSLKQKTRNWLWFVRTAMPSNVVKLTSSALPDLLSVVSEVMFASSTYFTMLL